MTEFFGIADAAVPTTRIVSLGDNINKFVPEFSDLTEGNIRNFIQEYLDGKLTVGKGRGREGEGGERGGGGGGRGREGGNFHGVEGA